MAPRQNAAALFVSLLFFLCIGFFVFFGHDRAPSAPRTLSEIPRPSPISKATLALAATETFPLLFEKNIGQVDSQFDFISRKGDATFVYAPNTLTLSFADGAIVTRTLLGADTKAISQPLGIVETVSNYFVGNDPKQWKTNVPNYSGITYASIYPNIDLTYTSTDGQLTEEFTVRPNGDVSKMHFQLSDIDMMSVSDAGDLVAKKGETTVMFRKLHAYQEVEGVKRPIDVSFRLLTMDSYGFSVGAYDHSKLLVIDPVLQVQYSTYFGGNLTETDRHIAVDHFGQAVIFGTTTSTVFPTSSPIQASSGGGTDLYLAKFNSAGTALLFSTFIGGSGTDSTFNDCMKLDASGDIYLSGNTASANFPTVSPYQAAISGTQDMFLMKVAANGSTILTSTYFGGTASESAGGVSVDSTGMYLFGSSTSTNYPLLNAYQSTNAGLADLVVTKFNPAGSALIYSTYLGGTGSEVARGMALGADGSVYLAGQTPNATFPTTVGAYQTTFAGSPFDATVTKLSPSGATLTYSSLLGGNGTDVPQAFALDPVTGDLWINGVTSSTNFPMVNPLQASYNGGIRDMTISKLNATGTALTFSTYYGGNGDDEPGNMMLDTNGNLVLGGFTTSTNFPVSHALQPIISGTQDAVLFRINPNLTVEYGTYLGGSLLEQAFGMDIDANNTIYLLGDTTSTDFPTQNPFQPALGGGRDLFITKIAYVNTLSYTAGANGSVTGASPQTVIYGTSGTAVTAVPDAHYHFVNWSDAVTSNPRTDTNVTGDISVTANFSIDTFTLNYSAGAGGTITGVTSQTVGYGANGGVVTAVPNPGAFFRRWSDGVTTPSRTETNVTSNVSVVADFGQGGVVRIVPPSASLVYPNGGERFVAGQTYQIGFASEGVAVNGVKISLSQDGGLTYPIIIVERVVVLGAYSWTPAVHLGGTAQAKIKINAIDSDGKVLASDESDSAFSILDSTATVLPVPPVPVQPPDPVLPPDPVPPVAVFSGLGLSVHQLVKVSGQTTVYYLGADGKRHMFTSAKIYFSWYCDFSSVRVISPDVLAALPMGQNVPYRPGLRMVKSPMNPQVYAVDAGWVLLPILNEATAYALYGPNWYSLIDDVDDGFYADYTFAPALTPSSDFAHAVKSASVQYPSDAMRIVGYQPSVGSFAVTCP